MPAVHLSAPYQYARRERLHRLRGWDVRPLQLAVELRRLPERQLLPGQRVCARRLRRGPVCARQRERLHVVPHRHVLSRWFLGSDAVCRRFVRPHGRRERVSALRRWLVLPLRCICAHRLPRRLLLSFGGICTDDVSL